MNPSHWRPSYPYSQALVRTGQEEPAKDETLKEERFLEQVKTGFKRITPVLILSGIAAGFAFAIGSSLGSAVIRHFSSPKRGARR
jgi:hypothetical protein